MVLQINESGRLFKLHWGHSGKDEYANILRIITTRKKWNIPSPNFVVGDLVLIADENIPRNNWLLARITEIHRSKDNVIRVVKQKTKFGTYTRPAANLCLLERSFAEK